MPNIPCANKISCLCDANPLQGVDSSAADVPQFLRVGYASLVPPLGTSFDRVMCAAPCESPASQQAADLCGNLLAEECVTSGWRGPSGAPFTLFFNSSQKGQVLCGDGLPFVFTVPAGVFGGPNQLAADTAAFTFANEQAAARLLCLSGNPANATVNQPYVGIITATGRFLAVSPQTDLWQVVSGTLPPGLTFNGGPITGGVATITGTPTVQGKYTFTVQVTDPLGDSMTKVFSLRVGPLAFDNLIWDKPPDSPPAGPASGSWVGGSISLSITLTPLFISVGNGTTGAPPLLYTGPKVTCNLHTVVTVLTNPAPTDSRVAVQQDGVIVLDADPIALGLGTHDFPFTIQAGSNSVIQVLIAQLSIAGAPAAAAFTAVLTP